MTVVDRGGALASLYALAEQPNGERKPDPTKRVHLVFKALADCTRREILCLLRQRSLSVGDIVDQFHLTQPSISRHLAILKSAGLVAYRRQGQRIIYTLGEPDPVELALGFLAELNGRPAVETPVTHPSRGA